MTSSNTITDTDLRWFNTGREAIRLAVETVPSYAFVKASAHTLPLAEEGYGNIWYQPDDKVIYFNIGPSHDFAKVAAYKSVLQNCPNTDHLEFDWITEPNAEEQWVRLSPLRKYAYESKYFKSDAELKKLPSVLAARAEQPVGIQPFSGVASAGGWKEGPVANLFGGPNAVSSTLASALLGAGLGYGTGWLAEKLLPEEYFERGRPRRTLAIAGGLAGATPPLWWAWAKHRSKQSSFISDASKELDDWLDPSLELSPEFAKAADNYGNASDYRPFSVDQFGSVMLSPEDRFTPAPIRSAITGFTEVAGYKSGDPDTFRPIDMTSILLGAGKGLVQSHLIGRTLGALAGLTPQAQSKLQQTGIWAGIVNSIAPKIFG